MPKPDYAAMRQAMVDSQLRASGVNMPTVADAMTRVYREEFVPADRGSVCYMDRCIPLGNGRVMHPPVTTGQMLEECDPALGDNALLIGGATGYVAALLAPRVARLTVVEEAEDLAAQAVPVIDAAANAELKIAPMNEGHGADAPYSLIWIEGAIEQLPQQIEAQLADGGRLVCGTFDGAVSRLSIGMKRGGELALRSFADADIRLLPGFAKAKAFTF